MFYKYKLLKSIFVRKQLALQKMVKRLTSGYFNLRLVPYEYVSRTIYSVTEEEKVLGQTLVISGAQNKTIMQPK